MRRLAERLPPRRFAGFYTAEMRSRGVRQGFRLIGFDGSEAVIAHVDFPKATRVGKYGVDVGAIDRAADGALAPEAGVEVYLVDEIGKMECLSERFVAHMRRLFGGRVPVIATLALRGEGFIAQVKRRDDCELRTLTRANRDALPDEMLAWLAAR